MPDDQIRKAPWSR